MNTKREGFSTGNRAERIVNTKPSKNYGVWYVIRGVNKNIIEISDTGNECFERAILFIRSERGGGDPELSAKAKSYLTELKYRKGLLGRGRYALALTILASALAGAVISAVLLLIFI